MAILSPEAKTMIATMHPGMVATADSSGRPNVSPKGSFMVLAHAHVAFADVHSPRTIANLRQNPQVTAIVYDAATRHGCRVWGKAEILDSGEVFDKLTAALAARNMTANHVVVVSVDEYMTF